MGERQIQENGVKSENAWTGIVCGFCLFIMVCLLLLLSMHRTVQVTGSPQVGLLLFLLPGAIASFFSAQRRLVRPFLGAILAAPVCFVMIRLFFTSQYSCWQQLSWLVSAVFWCVFGALCFLLIYAGLRSRDKASLKR